MSIAIYRTSLMSLSLLTFFKSYIVCKDKKIYYDLDFKFYLNDNMICWRYQSKHIQKMRLAIEKSLLSKI
jgi:hypothetical protein